MKCLRRSREEACLVKKEIKNEDDLFCCSHDHRARQKLDEHEFIIKN